MNLFSTLDIVHGDLPPWINNFVALTRPLTTSAIIAIPSIGAFTVGTVAGFNAEAAMNMAEASTAFLKGIPDAAYGMIAALGLGYTAGKTAEAIKAKPPVGSTSPEAGPNAASPAGEVDFAPSSRT